MPPTPQELAALLPSLSGVPLDASSALTLYLFLPYSFVDGQGITQNVRSSLEALLRDTRRSVGRDDQGQLVNFDHSRTWLGALGYLALVDQISTLLGVPNTPKDATSFERLLVWDNCVLDDEAAALYALRCAFAHSYGLLNEPPQTMRADRRRLLRHVFALSAHGGDLVTLGDRTHTVVDGPVEMLPPTVVDLVTLGNEIERLIADIRQHHLDGRGLPLRSDVDPAHVGAACFFVHPDPIRPGEIRLIDIP